MEHFHVAHRNSAYRIPVVGVTQVDEILFLGMARVIPVLESNLDSSLYCCGTVVRIKHLVQTRRRYFHQLLRQLRRRFINEAQEGAVLYLVQFRNNCVIDFPAAMAVDIYPQAGDCIQIFFPIRIIQLYPVSMVNNQLGIFQPAFHLGKGMPDIFFVKFFPFIHQYSLLSKLI